MRSTYLVLLFLALGGASVLAACQAPSTGAATSHAATASSAAERGTSYADPIVLDGITDEGSGVRAEHIYTDKHYPGYRWSGQSLANKNGKIYDVIELAKDGQTKTIYFDITDWFGKM
jgi:hypothetical protein